MGLDEMEALYKALDSPHGIVIRVSDFNLAQARLYRARLKAQDPSLSVLQFRRSLTGADNELWIVRTVPSSSPAKQESDNAET